MKNLIPLYFKRDSQYRYRIILGFFVIYFIIGLFNFKDYGISFDEPLQRLQGIVSFNYIVEKIAPAKAIPDMLPLHLFWNKDYGVAFDTPAYFVEWFFNFDETSVSIYYLRHFLTFLLFFVAVVYVYKLTVKYFKDWRLGLLASLLLILSPRLFAESFYNNKDSVFLSAFIIGMYYLLCFLEDKTYRSAVLFGLASGFAIGNRIPGIILPVVGLSLYVFEMIIFRQRGLKHNFLVFLVGIGSLLIFTIGLWPYLWENPWGNFWQAYNNMAHFRWDGSVLYFGKAVSAQQLPWHYIPAWLLLTTPILYSLFFFSGLVTIVLHLVQKIKKVVYDHDGRFYLVVTGLFFIPLLTVILLHSVLYDGWRQMYFIYAPFLFIALLGFVSVQKIIARLPYRFSRYLVPGVMGLGLIWAMICMIRLHPFEQTYFNVVAQAHERKFDIDYWGLSYRQGWEWLAHHKEGNLVVNVNNAPGRMNALFLKPRDQQRVLFTSPENADYIMTEYRNQYNCEYKNPIKIFYSGPAKVMGIYEGHQICRPL